MSGCYGFRPGLLTESDRMARNDRLMRLMDAMRRLPAPVTASRLAGETGVSPRQLYRDIATLRFAAIGERHLIHAFAHRCGRRRTSNAAWGGRAYEAQHALGTTSTSTVGAGYACAA